MKPQRNSQRGVDPQLTAAFIRGLDGVVDAAAWILRDTLLCQVTVEPESNICPDELQRECESALGPDQTPRMVLLIRAKRPAA